jgi:transcriptional regulator with XRE-family HTH domain
MVLLEMRGRPKIILDDSFPSSSRYAFPRKLRELRKHKGWSQADVARRIGVERSLVGNYELGVHQPALPTLLKLADIFQVSLDYLVFDEAPASDQIHDKQLLTFFVQADSLPYETKAMIKSLIEGLLAKGELEQMKREAHQKR